jgi:hypothetical protein
MALSGVAAAVQSIILECERAAAAAGKNCCQCFSQKKLFILIKLFRGEAYSESSARDDKYPPQEAPRRARSYDDEFF